MPREPEPKQLPDTKNRAPHGLTPSDAFKELVRLLARQAAQEQHDQVGKEPD